MTKLLTYEEAKHTIEINFKPAFLGEEEAVLLEANNRVLSENIVSPLDLPSFNTSAVNGYALNSQESTEANEEAPTVLKVAGAIAVGEQPKVALTKGEAVEVSVGAVLPMGADAVVAAQDVEREDDVLHLFSPVCAWENVRKQGSDIQKGALVLKKGQVLGAAEIGVLAALGFKQVKVLKYPMVAVLSIGDEVNELSKPLQTGKRFDVNAYSICTAVMECGAKAIYFGAFPNNKAAIERALRAASASSDMVVATSTVDASEIVDLLGKPGVVVNGVAVKPGKTTVIGFVGEKPVFLFPSNPSAALIMFQLFTRSILQRLCGRPVSDLKTVRAFAGSKLFSAKGSRTFSLVKLAFDEQCRLIADPVETCGEVSALVEADGFVEIAENEHFLDVDQEVLVRLLRGTAGKA
ncbi:MAG: molybdopterin-binding protein [Candidatus Bathyarchaeota archaeon]|nr:molybdopterin-binding protein [Candidatus Bathyarchaeota archaeon]